MRDKFTTFLYLAWFFGAPFLAFVAVSSETSWQHWGEALFIVWLMSVVWEVRGKWDEFNASTSPESSSEK